MTTSLLDAAQALIDLYYQDYAPDGAFIDLTHARMLMYSEYERMLQEEYIQAKMLNRTLEGFGFVTLGSDMLTPATVDIEKDGEMYVGWLPTQAYSFSYDSMGSGVQRVINRDASCKTRDLIRISSNDAWMYCITPPTNKTFFYPETISEGINCPIKTRIVILGDCFPKQVEVMYLPSLSEGGDIQVNSRFIKRMTDSVLQTLLIAKQQVVIDKTNDGNPNTVVATEANPDNINANP